MNCTISGEEKHTYKSISVCRACFSTVADCDSAERIHLTTGNCVESNRGDGKIEGPVVVVCCREEKELEMMIGPVSHLGRGEGGGWAAQQNRAKED